MSTDVKTVTLYCRHSVRYPVPFPNIGDTVYCRLCRDYREVLALTYEFQVRCGQCVLSRRYGRDQDAASRAASRHVLKYPSHTVSIMDGADEVERVSTMEGQQSLPYEQVLSKRADAVRKSQRSLRDFIERYQTDAKL